MSLTLVAAFHVLVLTRDVAPPKWLKDPQHITTDLKRADVRVLIHALGEAGHLNVVIADAITGRVTLKIRDLAWDEALAAVLKSKQLGMVRLGNLIRVDTLANLDAEKHSR